MSMMNSKMKKLWDWLPKEPHAFPYFVHQILESTSTLYCIFNWMLNILVIIVSFILPYCTTTSIKKDHYFYWQLHARASEWKWFILPYCTTTSIKKDNYFYQQLHARPSEWKWFIIPYCTTTSIKKDHYFYWQLHEWKLENDLPFEELCYNHALLLQ